MRIGYARVSTRDQNLEMQFDALAKAACMRIFTDKLSGAEVERPGLKEALSHLQDCGQRFRTEFEPPGGQRTTRSNRPV